jgi:uncharacterized protein
MTQEETSPISQLHFISARSQGSFASYEVSLPAKLEKMLEKYEFSRFIEKGEYVAIKTHFGSMGGHRITRPIFLKKVVEAVKKAGGQPFVCDTVRLPGIEYLEAASQNGLNAATLGCPVVLADGLFGQSAVKVPAGVMGEIGIASEIYDAKTMIVVSHCKGHIGAGFGGAIKNLAMGCVSSGIRCEGKNRARIHAAESSNVSWVAEKCKLCGECVKACDHGALEMYGGQIVVNYAECQKCGRCTRICPEHALLLEASEQHFHRGMGDATKSVLDTFKAGKVHYLNFIMEVMPHCDCHQHSDVPIINDQGIFLGDDPLAIDLASLELIESRQLCPDSAADGHEPGEGLFQRITGRNARFYLDRCQKHGIGNTRYEIKGK